MTNLDQGTLQRLRLVVQGIVQGVGFRPFVYRQALHQGLTGFVLNTSSGVVIEVEGTVQALEDFQRALSEEAPPLVRIVSLTRESLPVHHETTFVILHSEAGPERRALISPDIAPCDDCLQEFFNPANRRSQYPFTNCTNCGPRFTIIQDIPYDRDKTTMRVFPMCPACQQEYDAPLNRRFHAQPNACSICGPRVSLLVKDEAGHFCETASDDPIIQAARLLATGALIAVKGLGGYHLACDALNAEAVHCLRQRKHREAKPFALMVPDLETARQLCHISGAEAVLLQVSQRPIVLLHQRNECLVAPDVAPDSDTLGIMLPYTPLHYLLFHAFAQTRKPNCPAVLVMTSGNLSEEPIAFKDDDARERLQPLADSMLIHNREIQVRCDDSVMRLCAGKIQFVRRSRGYVPEPIPFPFELPLPLLACGAHLKNTFCLGKGQQVFLSHHIGDIENVETLLSFREGIEHFQRLFDIVPKAIAYDLHPEYLATKYALESDIVPKIGVQHHHAHIASVLAEHGLTEPVIGVAADGTGYGTDGTIWGCEMLVADLLNFERVAHLASVPLPGGEQAVRQPWRMGAVYLARTYGDAFLELDIPFVRQIERSKWHLLSQMIAKNLNCPQTSSLGRLFDAVAAITGLFNEVLYEGQAARALEVLAKKCPDPVTCYPFVIQQGMPATLNVVPLIDALVTDIMQGMPTAYIAKRFHLSVAQMLATACVQVHLRTGLNKVALSGGVFQNQLLLEQLITLLEEMDFEVYVNRLVPPNDGGLSLGQIAVAAARLERHIYEKSSIKV